MNIRNSAERMSEDYLSCEVWKFWFYDYYGLLVLDYYAKMSRPTKRHKFRADEWWSRLDNRGSSLKIEDVPFPDDVTTEAREKFIAQIKVVKECPR